MVPDGGGPDGRVKAVEDRDRRARSFGAVADRYARARPGYPAAAVEWLLEAAPGREVVDLAAGTGKLTEAIVESGASVVAVEPDDEMRATLRAGLPDVEALAGAAETIPLADASAARSSSRRRFTGSSRGRRAPRSRASWPAASGLVWNLRDGSVPWVADLDRLLDWPADVVARAGELSFEEIERHPAFTADGRAELLEPGGVHAVAARRSNTPWPRCSCPLLVRFVLLHPWHLHVDRGEEAGWATGSSPPAPSRSPSCSPSTDGSPGAPAPPRAAAVLPRHRAGQRPPVLLHHACAGRARVAAHRRRRRGELTGKFLVGYRLWLRRRA